MKFLIDEDLPRSTAEMLRAAGHEVLDVRDCGLRGASDDEVYSFAQKEEAVVLTGDVGFGNQYKFPPGTHHGILIAHYPNEISTPELNRQILAGVSSLADADYVGNLIIFQPGKIRLRRKT
jgi:predicted nuclease of predicted toxin-antitoxin system